MTPQKQGKSKNKDKSKSNYPTSANNGQIWGTLDMAGARLEDADVVFAGELADFVAHFQFEEGAEDL